MNHQREQILSRLATLLRAVWRRHPPEPLDPATALTEAGLSSGDFVVFLSRIEDEFSVDWEDLSPAPGALASLAGIADLVCSQPTGA